jgi:hypothetical protein
VTETPKEFAEAATDPLHDGDAMKLHANVAVAVAGPVSVTEPALPDHPENENPAAGAADSWTTVPEG